MNEGLNPDTIEPNEGEYSPGWWRETARMADRGYLRFCKKRGMDPQAGSMRNQISADARGGMARLARVRRQFQEEDEEL